jgi:hypothetical protein
MTTLPTWLAVLLALAGPFTAVLAIFAAEIRGRSNQKHESVLRLREDRLRAYLALTKASKMVDPSEEYQHRDLAEAHAEIELLTDNVRLREEADLVVQAASQWRRISRNAHEKGLPNISRTTNFQEAKKVLTEHRSAFIQLAKEELESNKG